MSVMIAIGLNHHTAPIELREQVARVLQDTASVLQHCKESGLVSEISVLSTCNRVEIYGVSESRGQQLLEWLAEKGQFVMDVVAKHFYVLYDQDAVQHLFRVISSLDSMIVGENQIVAQVKQAYQQAEQAKTVGPILRRCMDRALVVAKRVRSQTTISQGSVSIGRAGVELASQVIGELKNSTALLLGAGEHGQLIATNLKAKGIKELMVCNRTFARAAELAEVFGGSAVPIAELEHYLCKSDIVISCIGGGDVLIQYSMVEKAVKQRRYKPMVLIDLSMPRVIDSAVQNIEDAYLFDIDDLKHITAEGGNLRQQQAQEAEKIIIEETVYCWKILHADQHNQQIGAVFQHAHQVRQLELQRFFQGVDLSAEQQKAVEQMTASLVKKILHHPIQRAHQLAQEGNVHELHNLLQALMGQMEHANGDVSSVESSTTEDRK